MEPNYLNILPKDVRNMVDLYVKKQRANRLGLLIFLGTIGWKDLPLKEAKIFKEEAENLIDKHNIDWDIILGSNKSYPEISIYSKRNENVQISDKTLIEFINTFQHLLDRADVIYMNETLLDYGSDIRIIELRGGYQAGWFSTNHGQ